MDKISKTSTYSIIGFLVLIGIFSVYFVLAETPEKDNFLPISNEFGEITYGSDWKDTPLGNGKKEFISYGTGSNQHIFEDGGIKLQENARSLKSVYEDYINVIGDGKGNEIRVVDFNLTDAHICFKASYTGVVPFKIYKIEEVLNEELQEYLYERVYTTDTTIAIIAKDIEQCVWIKTNILQYNIVFGDEIYEE